MKLIYIIQIFLSVINLLVAIIFININYAFLFKPQPVINPISINFK